jgi:tripartite-type tricarboxylate transporter receptor subunit TctC
VKKPLRRRLALGLTLLPALLMASVGSRAADPYPTRPIRIVVASAAGGALDITTRMVAKQMGDTLGQQVVVENRVGAGSLIALRSVKAAPADGYTLLAGVNTVAIQQALSVDPGYDLMKDFVGVGLLTRAPFLLVTGAGQPDRKLPDLLARARARPGKVTYASAGIGSTTHLAAALFAQRAGAELVHVPYKGNSAAWTDLVAGRVDLLMEGYAAGASLIKEGKLRALGVTSRSRIEALPDVPTINEQGVPGYSFYFWIGLLAPAGTPPEVVQKLSGALRGAMANAELSRRFRADGAEPMNLSPEETSEFLRGESAAAFKLAAELNLPRE